MDLCTISEREDVGIQVPVGRMLFNICREPYNNVLAISLDLIFCLRVVCYREDVLDPQDLADVLKES